MKGFKLDSLDDEIGRIEEFYFDDQRWAIRYLVVDTKNWWPGKKVLVSPQWIGRVSWDEWKVFGDLNDLESRINSPLPTATLGHVLSILVVVLLVLNEFCLELLLQCEAIVTCLRQAVDEPPFKVSTKGDGSDFIALTVSPSAAAKRC